MRATTRYSTIPIPAMVMSVANNNAVSNKLPRARLMRTPSPRSAPAHSATIAPTTASVTPTRKPPRICGRAPGISNVHRICRRDARRLRASSISFASIGSEADHCRDGDGKEDDQRADQHSAPQSAPEPEVDQRSQRKDRRGLGGHDVRREQSLGHGPSSQHDPDRDAGRASHQDPEKDLGEGLERVRFDGPVDPGLDEAVEDGGRSGQDEGRIVHQANDQLPANHEQRRPPQ